MHFNEIPKENLDVLRRGAAIPAHLLALDQDRKLDVRHQRAMTRYYLDAGAGGIAIGVHATQFAIRDVGLYEPVLELAMRTASEWTPIGGKRPLFMVAGLAGKTQQAVREARIAQQLGYHGALLSLVAMKGAGEDELIAHCQAVAEVMPVIGFYLQRAVGGVDLPTSFWRRFAEIDNVIAIKMAPFDRYRTLDVVRGVVAARAEGRVTLYTGNDDHIVLDLLAPFTVMRDGRPVTVRIKGGLLGHWSVWTKRAVEMLGRIHEAVDKREVTPELLALDSQVTDCNSAVFDVANNFHGCIAGCHEVLRRQGLMQGVWCLDPNEGLSPGQAEELTRVQQDWPHLTDDDFVKANLERWLA
jgi:hypothetical protein